MAFAVSPSATMRAMAWVLRGKRVRGWNLTYLIAADHPDYYRRWIEYGELHHIRHFLASRVTGGKAPVITCMILGPGVANAAERSVTSVCDAFDGTVGICSNVSIAASIGRNGTLQELIDHLDFTTGWLLPLVAGDIVSADIGRVLAHVAPDAVRESIIFWDEDILQGGMRTKPWLKPRWDPLLARSLDLLAGTAMISIEALRAEAEADPSIGCDAGSIAEAIRRAAHRDSMEPLHIPLILTHRADRPPPPPIYYRATSGDDDIAEAITTWPSVTIIIPTRDRADLLTACVEGLGRLDYAGKIEILIVDNDSVEADTHVLFDRLRRAGAIVLPYRDAFNFAAMTNLAAAKAKGDMLCLLNNDVEPLDGAWLTEMVRYAMHDRVGAAGARLLYPNGTIQHVGVAAGVGDAAGHVQKGIAPADTRFDEWHAHTRTVSAVTAACLVVDRQLFEAVGGMDPEAFAIDFNDVDLCWRLQREGFVNVIVVEATLLHRESVSRNSSRSQESIARFGRELDRLRARWNTATVQDPYYHPMFRRECERCLLAF